MGLFLKDTPESLAKKTAKEEAKKIKAASKPIEMTPQFVITQQTVANMAGIADDKFVEMLWSVISQNNIPGQDYFEFKQALDAMASLPIDEKNKFLTTFMIFNSQGCKKETLLSSLERYESLIKKEQANFAAEFESQRGEKVNSKLTKIEEAKRKVEELNKQITEANTFILTASSEAQQEEMKLQMTNANFNKSAEKVLSLLESDKEKINNYIV
jgi:hypothetical protein